MKKKILIVMPYENLYPPKNGGIQRCFHIFHQLTKYFDVTAITHANKQNLITGAKNYPSVVSADILTSYGKKQKKDIFSFLPVNIGNAVRYRWIIKKINQSADSSFLKLYPFLKTILKRKRFDFIILENLSLVAQASWIRKYNKNAQIIYNSYNVDSILARQAAIKEPSKNNEAKIILRTETNLYKVIDGIFCCSKVDLEAFTQMNKNKIKLSAVVPNGVDTNFFSYSANTDEQQLKNIIFCGSLDYAPNKEGLLWFYKNVWPLVHSKLPGSLLYIIGRGDRQSYQQLIEDETVNFIGEVEEVTEWYRKCNVAIAPLMQGSGTRLKILEAMSLGNPVVTTKIGIEGIEAEKDKNVLIADEPAAFANEIIRLSTDPAYSEFLSKNARSLVDNKYSWDIIGYSLAHLIESWA